jgi:endonuclease G, mitochondrial
MAQLRRNHHKASTGTSRFLIVLIIIGFLVFALLYKGKPYLETIFNQEQNEIIIHPNNSIILENSYDDLSTKKRHLDFPLLPSYSGELIFHDHFTLSFSQKFKQAEWAAWQVTKTDLRLPNQKRKTFFTEDPKLSTAKLGVFDYRGSGYQRGHLVPAADVAFDTNAIAQSHYMTNMSPQKRAFNNGIWRELEQLTREWAWKYGKVNVVTGPIFIEPVQYMKSGVAIPNSFYRVLLTQIDNKPHAIGFIIGNVVSERHLHEYATTINEVEFITGIEFFSGHLKTSEAKLVKPTYNTDLWPINDQAFRLRTTRWNYE